MFFLFLFIFGVVFCVVLLFVVFCLWWVIVLFIVGVFLLLFIVVLEQVVQLLWLWLVFVFFVFVLFVGVVIFLYGVRFGVFIFIFGVIVLFLVLLLWFDVVVFLELLVSVIVDLIVMIFVVFVMFLIVVLVVVWVRVVVELMCEKEYSVLEEVWCVFVEECIRIVRELYDVVVYSMFVIQVQVLMVCYWILDFGEVVMVEFDDIVVIVRSFFIEMWCMLGVFCMEDQSVELVLQQGVFDILVFVDSICCVGVEVGFVIEGGDFVEIVGFVVQIVVFCIVQEVLSNVVCYVLGVWIVVWLWVEDWSICICVFNQNLLCSVEYYGGGYGFCGMCECLEIFGGSFIVGFLFEGGWVVEVVLFFDFELIMMVIVFVFVFVFDKEIL